MSGNVFNKQVAFDETMDIALSVVLIVLVILFFIFFLLQAIQALIKVCKEVRKNRKRKAGGKDGDGEAVADDDSSPLAGSTLSSDGSFRQARTSSQSSRKAQTQADWVNEYKAGSDITTAVDRGGLRRKQGAGTVVTAKDLIVTAPADSVAGPGGEAGHHSRGMSVARNPLWSGGDALKVEAPAPAPGLAKPELTAGFTL